METTTNTVFAIEIGKGLTINVDRFKMPTNSLDHIFRIGCRNILMDAHASVKRDTYPEGEAGTKEWRDASLAMSVKKLEALLRGDVRANAVARASTVDPVEAEALRMARVFVGKASRQYESDGTAGREWAIKAGKALGMPVETNDELKAVIAEAIKRRAARDDVKEAARKAVEAAKALTVDEADLGL